MANYPIQTNLTAGELSPLLALRVDFGKYANGVAAQENYLNLPQGGVTRRDGTAFVAEVKDSTKATRLIPFEFSTTQAYILEVGDQYMRFYRDNGRIESPPGTPVEIATTYLEAELFDLHFAQSADTLYITHPLHAPAKLTRTSHTAWTLTDITFLDGPYFDENLTTPNSAKSTITLTPSAATGSGITITASSAIFVSTDVGRFIRMSQGGVWGYVVVTAYTDSTHVTADVLLTLTSTAAKTIWRLGAWGETTGYPSTCTFFEDRLMFANSTTQPQAVWGSVTGDYEDMTPGANDADAVVYVIASNQVNAIAWLASSIGLVIGTVGGEFVMFGGNDSPLTPTNVTVRRQSTYGSALIRPVQAGSSTLFVQRAGLKVRDINFSGDSGAYKATDVTLLSEHITSPGLVELAYQQEPNSTMYAVRSDGVLLSLTFKPEQEVIAWARQITDGLFESVATIPTATANQTWVIVNRTIESVAVRYVEYLDPALYMDSALTYSGVATGTVTGLDHLEGETVTIQGDAATYPSAVVASGSVTLDGPDAEEIQVGLPFTPLVTSLRPEVKMSNGGTSQGRPKRWAEIFVRVVNTRGLDIEGDEVPWRHGDDLMDTAPPLYTGDKRVSNSGWDTDGTFTLTQPRPQPSTILGWFGTLDVGGQSG